MAATVIIMAAVLVAPEAAVASKPIRTVIFPTGFIDTSLCGFGVQGQPDPNARQAITEFEDGRIQVIGHAEPTLTNLTSGVSIATKSRYLSVERYDATANDVVLEVHGRVFWTFAPGDQGPFGLVGATGAMFRIVGHSTATIDLDTDVITSFSWTGQSTDLCAQLAG